MWSTYFILLFCMMYTVLTLHQGVKSKSRSKRYLLFTPETQFGVFATVSVPLHPDSTVSVAWFFEANYYNVDNATYFEPLLGDIGTATRVRSERSTGEMRKGLSRKYVYITLENMLEKYGFEGRACLLRAICENTTSHFLHNGVLGDILHLVLTPSTSMMEEDLEDCYYEAQYLGLEDRCDYYADECPSSPLHDISLDVEETL